MRTRNYKYRKITGAVLAVMILILAIPFSGKAAEEIMITVPFYSAGMWDMKWDFPYSDDYFLGSSDVFSRDLAKASLGLTISAFREEVASDILNQYETYLGTAGFTDIYSFGYDQPTSTETLSGVIASKKINDFTLIAVSPCGQGYGKEWGSNFYLGDGERHAGFDHGARILEQEIDSYLEAHHLSGKLKLWISSFSRGSAVSNLAAADLTESGQFEDVYAYLYAVPRTTKKEVGYVNIINICGAFDPVTQIPLESWGYFRNGWDLYLPAAETDADYESLINHVNDVTMTAAHDYFRNNPEWNYQIHLILEFLGEMFPTTEEYAEKLQEEIVSLWTEANPDQIFQILSAVFTSLDDLDLRQEYSRDVIISYLQYLAALRMQDTRGSSEQRDIAWASDQGMGANLMREHMPYIYLSWIFSDLPDDQLFEGSFATQRLAIIGDVDVEIWQGDQFLNRIDQNGKWTAGEDYRSVFAERSGLETMVFLPANDDFQVRIITRNPTGFSFRSDTCYLPSTYGASNGYHVVLATPGTYELDFFKYQDEPGDLSALEGTILSDTVSDREYSPTLTMQLQTESDHHLTVTTILAGMTGFSLLFLLFLLVCLIIAIVHAVRKKVHGPYSPLYVIIPHCLVLLLFVWLTIYFTKTLYMIRYARMGFAAASGLVLLLLALRGLIRNRNLPNVLITMGMLGSSALNVLLYQPSQIAGAGTGINVLYCVIMAGLTALASSTFWIGRRKHK
ncbi:MAG: hypothetical protein IJ106_07595 [Parasporobacterium sp.]|nr:hypothetical protein [Parasporobacterium sp.]